MNYTPESELRKRLDKFQKALRKKGIDGAIIIQRADLFYFSGTGQAAHLVVPSSNDPFLLAKKNFHRAQMESNLPIIEPMPTMKSFPSKVQSILGKVHKIGMELDVIPTNLYFKYKKMFPQSEIVDVSSLILKIRMKKSEFELKIIKQAGKMNDEMFSKIPDFLEVGISEVEFAGRLEAFYRKKGHQGGIRMRRFNQELYYGHVMSGSNVAIPSFFDGPTGGSGVSPSYPQGAGFKKIVKNEPIWIDYAGVLGGYIVDQTRIFAFNSLPDKLIKAYDTVLAIVRFLKENCKPGVLCTDIYDGSYEIAKKEGLENYFMGYKSDVKWVGHGVGIELDELPVLAKNFKMPLEKSMVFAFEPKFVFPDIGGAGIENTYYVTDSGVEPLTTFSNDVQLIY